MNISGKEEKGRWEEGAVRQWVFSLPKGGHGDEEYEDAFAHSEAGTWPVRAAVADGATEAAFSGTWARRLAHGFVQAGAEAWTARLAACQCAWAERVAGRRNPPWYVAAKIAEGAFAAALGLEVEGSGHWQAWAVGDGCLFHLRGGTERLRWPLNAPEAFGYHPALVPSRPEQPAPEMQTYTGTYRPGDAFLLATDALAAWLMRTGPARALAFDAQTFQAEVEAARAGGTLRNDDATLFVLEIDRPAPG